MTYTKEFLIDVAMDNYSAHFAITRVIRGERKGDTDKWQRIKKGLEKEYDVIGKQEFRKLHGITPYKIESFIDAG